MCDKTFAKTAYLTRHFKAVHDKIRPNKCPKCPYAAFAARALKLHFARIHKDDTLPPKPKICSICNTEFSSLPAMYRHIREAHHKERPYKCSMCEYSSSAKYGVHRHFDQMHVTRPETLLEVPSTLFAPPN
jgi:KRAB domain-containing zinc finger protein